MCAQAFFPEEEKSDSEPQRSMGKRLCYECGNELTDKQDIISQEIDNTLWALSKCPCGNEQWYRSGNKREGTKSTEDEFQPHKIELGNENEEPMASRPSDKALKGETQNLGVLDDIPSCEQCRERLKKCGQRESGSQTYVCMNPSCSSFKPSQKRGRRYSLNIKCTIHSPFTGKLIGKASNKLTEKLQLKVYQMFYEESKSADEIAKILQREHCVTLSPNTVTNTAMKVASLLKGEFLLPDLLRSEHAKQLLGYRDGNAVRYYGILDTSVYPISNGKVLLYMVSDYPSGLVLDYEIMEGAQPSWRGVEQLLCRISNGGYRFDVLVSDRGKENLFPIQSYCDKTGCKHQFCRVHLEDEIKAHILNENSILHPPKNKEHERKRSPSQAAEKFGHQLLSILRNETLGGFRYAVEQLAEDERRSTLDSNTRRFIKEFIHNSEHYAVHYSYHGCPDNTNKQEAIFSVLDRKRRAKNRSQTKEKWIKHVVGLIVAKNKRILQREL